MKVRRFLCYILIFLFCTTVYAQNKGPTGIELCRQVHTFLKRNGFSPSTQNLVASGENTFPYNIIVTFPAEQNTSPENLLLVFFQEDIPQNRALIKEELKKFKEAHYPFTITALFAYGEKQTISKADMIYGTEVFLDSLNTNLSYTAVIFDLEAEKNEIETTSRGLASPPRLIKNALNLYSENGIGGKLPSVILSQLSSYKFISSRILDGFFDAEIPAIKLSLGGNADEDKFHIADAVISGFIKLFSESTDSSWEHHFFIVKLFGTYQIISEIMILHIVIPVVFLWILFIFMLIFVNRRLKKHTWYTIGSVWWSVPFTYIILTITFLLSAFFFRNLFPNASYAGKIYGKVVFQLIISLFFCLAFYLLILTVNFHFDERAVDYLLVISCFINQSIFILADISLSPIFIVICLLSLLALTVKNNYLHVAILILMIMPLIPYGHRMINSSNLKDLSEFLLKSTVSDIVIPFVLYPVFIVIFRIITSIRTSRKSVRSLIFYTILTFVLASAALICLGAVRTHQLKKQDASQPDITLSPLSEDIISLSVNDSNIFGDTIRSLDVKLNKSCLLCDVLVTTEDVNPVLYSDNDYTNPSANTARFRIPNNPPSEMTFRYGAAKTPCRITVSAVINGEKKGEYHFISRSLEVGEN